MCNQVAEIMGGPSICQYLEETIAVAAGATVVVRVADGNDRQIDNGKIAPDRQQIIAGIADHPLAGQMLRIDVVRVKTRYRQ